MLKFRRAVPSFRSAPRVPHPVTDAAPAPAPVTSNVQKARALITMLETGGGAGVPADRLRDWARDLVETVERRPAAPDATDPKEQPRPARLFSNPAPVLTKPGAPLAPKPMQNQVPTPHALPSSAARPDRPRRMTLTAPMPHSEASLARPAMPNVPAIHAMADVRKLVDGTADPGTLEREHPAVIALTLAGKPPLEQAACLRRLPGKQARAVHRALRQIERGPA